MMNEKTVTVKYGNVKNSQAFAQAMSKLMNLPIDTKTAYNLKRIKDGVTSKIPTIRKEFQEEVISKYGAKNEDGTLQSSPTNPDAFVPAQETFEAFLEADKAFAEKTFTLEGRFQLPGTTFTGAQFSANEIEALEGIIDWDTVDGTETKTSDSNHGANVLNMGFSK